MFTSVLTRRLPAAALRQIRRSLASGAPADTSTLYGRMMASNPLLTSALTGSMLWSSGDLVAQFLEVKGAGTHEQHIGGSHASEDDFGTGVPIIAAKTFDPKRTAGTVVHGAAVGGVGTYLWYNFLDGVVRGAMRLTPGGLPFVGAKLGLEIAIWHPTSLLAYWTICGTAQGHSFEKILRELRDSFVSTLVGDAIFWAPVDILCFWKVPVGLQTLFANAGCFVESIALSYIHDHGFDLFALVSSVASVASVSPVAPPTPQALSFTGASPLTGAPLKSDDLIAEPPSAAVAKFAGVSSLARSFASFGSRVDAVVAGASSQFDALDQDRNGRLTLKELQAAQGSLPGVQDQVVGAVMMRLISRRLFATKPNRGEGAAAELYMSKTEYLRMLDALHTTGYRKSRLADVVFAMFDENEDGQIDIRELRNLLCVVTGKEPKGKLVEDILKAADTDTNRKLSKAEFFALMQQMQLSVRL
jgi:hypothetical protein